MEKSYFDGGVLEHLALSIFTFIFIIITLGFGTPWAICMFHNWRVKHTIVEGKRLAFMGTGAGLFGSWIKWYFFCIITLGLYFFWLPISIQKWKAKHTCFAV